MKLVVLVIAVSGALAFPAVAQDAAMDAETMTCAEFTAMDSEGQMAAMEAMQAASMEADTGEMAAGNMDEETMEAGEMAAEGSMMSEEMTAMMSACEGNDDMMAMDAMHEAMGN